LLIASAVLAGSGCHGSRTDCDWRTSFSTSIVSVVIADDVRLADDYIVIPLAVVGTGTPEALERDAWWLMGYLQSAPSESIACRDVTFSDPTIHDDGESQLVDSHCPRGQINIVECGPHTRIALLRVPIRARVCGNSSRLRLRTDICASFCTDESADHLPGSPRRMVRPLIDDRWHPIQVSD
jgi:hypothetical protein